MVPMNEYIIELERLRELYDEGLYSAAFYASKVSRVQLSSYETFQTIPFTHKSELRNTTVEDRTATAPGDVYGVFSSSGTTGDKTFYIYNKIDKRVHEDCVRTYLGELGVCTTDLGAVMAPVDTGVMAHTMMWEFTTMGAGYVNCPVPTSENILNVVSSLPVTVIATRPSIASSIASDSHARAVARASKVRMLAVGGGFLSNARRQLIEDAWDAPCYNMFGMSEVFGPMAAECLQKSRFHYRKDYLMIEVIDPVTLCPVPHGELGVAVYTTLWSKGFPLLRYWTNDMLRLVDEPCRCGSDLPRFEFCGRLDDCYTIKGRYVFPQDVEEILIPAGCWGAYQVERNPQGIKIVEEGELSDKDGVRRRLEELFETPVDIQTVPVGTLAYDGHARRFSDARR